MTEDCDRRSIKVVGLIFLFALVRRINNASELITVSAKETHAIGFACQVSMFCKWTIQMDRWGNGQPSIDSQCDSVSWQIGSANTKDMCVARTVNTGVSSGPVSHQAERVTSQRAKNPAHRN
jgi:hypothetical protein